MLAHNSLFVLWLFILVELVAGHGAITGAVGDAGGNGTALGIIPSTPRDGTTKVPFEQDTTRFKGDAADTFGETLAGGDNDAETGTQAILAENGGTLPQITAGGSVQMTLHQVNADGAGPYTCMINADATGTTWTAMEVTQQVDGKLGLNIAGSKTDHALAASVPAGQTCTGTVAGQSNVCMVRCQNPALAGPFGGVVPVQLAGSTAATGSATNSTTIGSTTTATTATSADAADTATGDTTDTAAGGGTVSEGTLDAGNTAAGDQAAAEEDGEDDNTDEAATRMRARKRLVSSVGRRAAIKYVDF